MLEELYHDIPEKNLYDTYNRVNKKIKVTGSTAPSGFTGSIFTMSPHSPNTYDFTNSFLAYLNQNINLLNFKFSIVSQPAFIIFHIDRINPMNFQLKQIPEVVKSHKMPLTATETYILSSGISNIITFYDRIASEINYLVQRAGFDKQLYFYQLLGVKDVQTNILTFTLRCAINIKTM